MGGGDQCVYECNKKGQMYVEFSSPAARADKVGWDFKVGCQPKQVVPLTVIFWQIHRFFFPIFRSPTKGVKHKKIYTYNKDVLNTVF